jgi:hypothetical protein
MTILFLVLFYGVYLFLFAFIFGSSSSKSNSSPKISAERYLAWFMGHYKKSLKQSKIEQYRKKNSPFWPDSDY